MLPTTSANVFSPRVTSTDVPEAERGFQGPRHLERKPRRGWVYVVAVSLALLAYVGYVVAFGKGGVGLGPAFPQGLLGALLALLLGLALLVVVILVVGLTSPKRRWAPSPRRLSKARQFAQEDLANAEVRSPQRPAQAPAEAAGPTVKAGLGSAARRRFHDWASRPIDRKEERRRTWGAGVALVSLAFLAAGLWLAGQKEENEGAVMAVVQGGGLGLGGGLLMISWHRGMSGKAAAGTVAAGLNVGLALAMAMQVGPFAATLEEPLPPWPPRRHWVELAQGHLEGTWGPNSATAMDGARPSPSFVLPAGTEFLRLSVWGNQTASLAGGVLLGVDLQRERDGAWVTAHHYQQPSGQPAGLANFTADSGKYRLVVAPSGLDAGGQWSAQWAAAGRR
jgi:hypothetical protein